MLCDGDCHPHKGCGSPLPAWHKEKDLGQEQGQSVAEKLPDGFYCQPTRCGSTAKPLVSVRTVEIVN